MSTKIKYHYKREELILLIITLLFVLGFFMFSGTITGFTTENLTEFLNEVSNTNYTEVLENNSIEFSLPVVEETLDDVVEDVTDVIDGSIEVISNLDVELNDKIDLGGFRTEALAEGSTYNVRMYTSGLQGFKAEGSTYEARILLTAFQPGIDDAQGTTYSADVGFFSPYSEVIVKEEEEEPGPPGAGSGGPTETGRSASKIQESTVTVSGNLYSIRHAVPGITSLEIANPLLAIREIILDINREMRDIYIKVDESKNVRVEKPKARVYKYITIIPSNLADSALNEIRIKFRVQKMFGDEITLQRYVGVWKKLETKKVDEDIWFRYYEATSPGFSIFAITKPAIDIGKEVENIARAVIKKEEVGKMELWLYAIIPIIVICLVVLALLYYMIRKLKKYKKISFGVIIAGIGLVILLTPFTNEILYWVILPISIITVGIGLAGFILWKILKKGIGRRIRVKVR